MTDKTKAEEQAAHAILRTYGRVIEKAVRELPEQPTEADEAS